MKNEKAKVAEATPPHKIIDKKYKSIATGQIKENKIKIQISV